LGSGGSSGTIASKNARCSSLNWGAKSGVATYPDRETKRPRATQSRRVAINCRSPMTSSRDSANEVAPIAHGSAACSARNDRSMRASSSTSVLGDVFTEHRGDDVFGDVADDAVDRQ